MMRREDNPCPFALCIRRALKGEGIISSDYESSNESPVSSENNDLLSVDDHLSKSLAVQTVNQDLSRCTLCGGKTKHGVTMEGPARSPNMEDVTPTVQDTSEIYRKSFTVKWIEAFLFVSVRCKKGNVGFVN
ncbi:uncharacterized protein CEXT_554471 [Caerostris extrusa]|uniref:Uncharacterized protein n=1 Tax=Caerostris extrusa TaxID=172846 RepID=A0AAV4NH09_CAEEX|nr:uncharacterized protein CEXT_554471 [Caerostris extrusa]